jgi:hypothetical protein
VHHCRQKVRKSGQSLLQSCCDGAASSDIGFIKMVDSLIG